MHLSTQYERKSLFGWSCQDVDVLYEKISKVGSGTYGEVNKARDRANPSKFVALKKIKDQSETQGFPITAMREISLLQQCDHPNIVTLLNVATSNIPDPDSKRKKKRGSTFLVFEYMEHELLGLVQTYQFTTPQVKCIMKQLLEGLSYIHSKDIIHRDIKSANILMNNKGEVKIADFGLARKVNPNFTGKLTQRVVTRWYRAPELLLGCKKYSTQIDIWALGCVFAELLMGKSHALFPAQKTPDQMTLICEKCGTPNEREWPGIKDLPFYNTMVPKKNYPKILLQYMCKQNKNLDPTALDLLDKMLTFNPDTRITTEQALEHPYFNTSPLPCAVYEMPKFDKDCHAYVLNLKRKARANVKNPIEEVNDPSLTKITILNPNVVQPNVSYYDPNVVPEYNKTKSMYNQQNPIVVNSGNNHQVYSDPIITNTNNNYGQNIMTQNQNSNGNMNAFNNIINLTQISNANQNNDYSLTNMNNYNSMNNINNINNLNAVGKLGSLNSMNTHNTSNLDTTITNMTNLSYFNDFNTVNLSNASTLSNLSNLSNMSNSQNVTNPITNQNNPNNNSYVKQQNNNSFTGGYNRYNNNNPMLYLNYYLSMMNYPLQYNNKFEQELTANASFAPYLNNAKPLDFNPQEMAINAGENLNKLKEVKPTKSKSSGKRGKQVTNVNTNNAAMFDLLEDKKVMDTLNELNFDILELYNPVDDLVGFKRKGIPNIQDLDNMLKKRQLENPYGIN